jgi:hypothetical protein
MTLQGLFTIALKKIHGRGIRKAYKGCRIGRRPLPPCVALAAVVSACTNPGTVGETTGGRARIGPEGAVLRFGNERTAECLDVLEIGRRVSLSLAVEAGEEPGTGPAWLESLGMAHLRIFALLRGGNPPLG